MQRGGTAERFTGVKCDIRRSFEDGLKLLAEHLHSWTPRWQRLQRRKFRGVGGSGIDIGFINVTSEMSIQCPSGDGRQVF